MGHLAGSALSLAVTTLLPVAFYALGVFAALASRADTGGLLNVVLVPAVAAFVAALCVLCFGLVSSWLLRRRSRRPFPAWLPLLLAPIPAALPALAFALAVGAPSALRLAALGTLYLTAGFAAYWLPLAGIAGRPARAAPPDSGGR